MITLCLSSYMWDSYTTLLAIATDDLAVPILCILNLLLSSQSRFLWVNLCLLLGMWSTLCPCLSCVPSLVYWFTRLDTYEQTTEQTTYTATATPLTYTSIKPDAQVRDVFIHQTPCNTEDQEQLDTMDSIAYACSVQWNMFWLEVRQLTNLTSFKEHETHDVTKMQDKTSTS